jgi:hypothetical protein
VLAGKFFSLFWGGGLDSKAFTNIGENSLYSSQESGVFVVACLGQAGFLLRTFPAIPRTLPEESQ